MPIWSRSPCELANAPCTALPDSSSVCRRLEGHTARGGDASVVEGGEDGSKSSVEQIATESELTSRSMYIVQCLALAMMSSWCKGSGDDLGEKARVDHG